MKTTHTPGPWKARLAPSGIKRNNHWIIQADSPHIPGKIQVVAEMNGPWNPVNYKANAHLITAAPDLLAALTLATDEAQKGWDEGFVPPDWFDQARAAIAKAKGQP